MKMRNTFGIQFVIRISKSEEAFGSIFARITVNGKRSEISLKKKIETKNWDATKGKVRGTKEEACKLNEHIERVRTLISDAYYQLVQKKQTISVETVKAEFLGNNNESSMSLLQLCNYHNTEMESKLAKGTMKNYYTTQKYIALFLKQKYKRTDIALTDLNYKFILDFENFLMTRQPKDHQKKLHNNGTMKHLERLCKMTNMALMLEWMDKDPFARHKLHFEKVERFFLSKEELSWIEEKKITIERLEAVRDLFLFSCYTGLAYIDTMNLSKENILKGIDGEDWLMTSRQKTDTDVRIPLLPKALKLIQKYKGHPKAEHQGGLFPIISNQKMNAYLKEIADICGIQKPITFHIARHTFATTVTLSNGVPIESVSKMLGHTSIRTTQLYAKVVESKLSEDMRQLKLKMATG